MTFAEPPTPPAAVPALPSPTLAPADLDAVADGLLAARDAAVRQPLPSTRHAGFSLGDAYAVGERLRQRRMARGERPVGYKIGFTNRTIWDRYGVHAPIWAPVWDGTVRRLDGAAGTLSLTGLVQPRLEPEVVFSFARSPRAGMDEAALMGCLDGVSHGVEVVHTHYDDWRFTAPDGVADFSLHGALLIGPACDPACYAGDAAEQLAVLQVELLRDGVMVERGTARAVLDSPLRALRLWIDAMAVQTPHWRIEPGDVVTTGTITDAWPLAAGQRWETRLSDDRLVGLTLDVTA